MNSSSSQAAALAKPVGTGGAASSSTATRGGGATTQQKRIGDIVKRAQPHTIVQTYDKIMRAVQFVAQLVVNGEALSPEAAGAPSLQSGWKLRGREGASGDIAAGFFDPSRGRFHYALGFRFASSDPALSLSTIADIAVRVSSTSTSSAGACRQCAFAPLMPEPGSRPANRANRRIIAPATASGAATLSIKAWTLVAETPARVGLALYELPLCVAPKTSGRSSILALVWTRDRARLEVVALFAQIHVPELLATALVLPPSRPSLVVPLSPANARGCSGEDDDSTGLRGFTMALTLRALDRVIWEREWFQVDFPTPIKADRAGDDAVPRTVAAQLLDEHGAFRDRARYADSSVSVDVATDAMTVALDSAVVVDFCAWEESAMAPVWGFSRPARVAPSSAAAASSLSSTLGGDFTLTAAGKTHELLEVRVDDSAATGNHVAVQIVKTRAKTGGESARVLIKQVEVTMGVAFLNATFGMSH